MEDQLPLRVFTLRAIERLAVVFTGAFMIFLGYRLFLLLPQTAATTANVKIPGGFSAAWSHAGPGAFFVVFGAALLCHAVLAKAKWELSGSGGRVKGTKRGHPKFSESMMYLMGRSGTVDEAAREAALASLRTDFRLLDRVASLRGASSGDSMEIPTRDLLDLSTALPRLKLGLLFNVWDQNWGDFSAFCRWVDEGAFAPPPEGARVPASFILGPAGDES